MMAAAREGGDHRKNHFQIGPHFFHDCRGEDGAEFEDGAQRGGVSVCLVKHSGKMEQHCTIWWASASVGSSHFHQHIIPFTRDSPTTPSASIQMRRALDIPRAVCTQPHFQVEQELADTMERISGAPADVAETVSAARSPTRPLASSLFAVRRGRQPLDLEEAGSAAAYVTTANEFLTASGNVLGNATRRLQGEKRNNAPAQILKHKPRNLYSLLDFSTALILHLMLSEPNVMQLLMFQISSWLTATRPTRVQRSRGRV